MLLMIDNYDSFTYNLVQYLAELGAEVEVHRNDAISIAQIRAKNPSHIVISPGPCTPSEAGISLAVLADLSDFCPILGVCLGHQSIGQAFGGKVVRARQVMHGKTSMMHHTGKGVFSQLANPFEATRYHSLIVESASLPNCLEVTAWTALGNGGVDEIRDDEIRVDEIMGLRHKTLPIQGVQFHPESILTRVGKDLLRNFLESA